MADFITKLVEDLGSELLLIPFDAWLQVCERTRQRLMKKFPGVVPEAIAEDKARVWYLRYRNHCSETYTEFLKSVINCNAEYSNELAEMIRAKHPKNLRKNFNLASHGPLGGAKQKSSVSAVMKTPEVRNIVDYDDDDDAMSVVSSICDGPFKVPLPSLPPYQPCIKIDDDPTAHPSNGVNGYSHNDSRETDAPWSPTIAQRNMEDWEVGSEVGGRRSPLPIVPKIITLDRLEQEIFDGGNDFPSVRCRWDSPDRMPKEEAVRSDNGLNKDSDDDLVVWCKRLRRIAIPKRNKLMWKEYVIKKMLVEKNDFIEPSNPDLRFEDPRYLNVSKMDDTDDSDDELGDNSFESLHGSRDSSSSTEAATDNSEHLNHGTTAAVITRTDSDSSLDTLCERTEPLYSLKRSTDINQFTPSRLNMSRSDIRSPSSSSDSTILSPIPMALKTPFHLLGNSSPVVGVSTFQHESIQQVRPGSTTPLAALNNNNRERQRPCPPPPPILRKGRDRVRKASPPRNTVKKPTKWTDWHRR